MIQSNLQYLEMEVSGHCKRVACNMTGQPPIMRSHDLSLAAKVLNHSQHDLTIFL